MARTPARTVAVVGAGPERRKFGNKSVRAHVAAGYMVYPIHPKAKTVEGLTAYSSVKDLPAEKLDRVTVYLPPSIGMTVLADIATKSPGEVWFNPGADSPEVLAEAKRLGLKAIAACSIVDLGLSPAMFPDE
jgi:predicted CoA-binding protein